MTKTPDEYNAAEFVAGRLTPQHITRLVKAFQRENNLDDDGKAGPRTRALLDGSIWPQASPENVPRVWPLRCLANGRKPEITSRHFSENPDRQTHRGVDLFYRHLGDDDPTAKRGDGGGAGHETDGTVKWWIPPGTMACVSANGIVEMAGVSPTGYRVWINVGPVYDGYFHLRNILVKPGQHVKAGDYVGEVGDNPLDIDATHLHFEIYQGDLGDYRTVKTNSLNPRLFLSRATYLL